MEFKMLVFIVVFNNRSIDYEVWFRDGYYMSNSMKGVKFVYF